tara:strand:+ start:173 stop:394 length:222 start_codon:yes stop_codon:yes gene_type:complete
VGVGDVGAVTHGLGFGKTEDLHLLLAGLLYKAPDRRGVLVKVRRLPTLRQTNPQFAHIYLPLSQRHCFFTHIK